MSFESMMPSNHLILCHSLLLLPSVFPSIRVFPVSQFLASGGQSIGTSTSASVLALYIQGWLPLGLTGLISMQSKGLSRVFSSTIVHFQHSLFFSVDFSFHWLPSSFCLSFSFNICFCASLVTMNFFSYFSFFLFSFFPFHPKKNFYYVSFLPGIFAHYRILKFFKDLIPLCSGLYTSWQKFCCNSCLCLEKRVLSIMANFKFFFFLFITDF